MQRLPPWSKLNPTIENEEKIVTRRIKNKYFLDKVWGGWIGRLRLLHDDKH